MTADLRPSVHACVAAEAEKVNARAVAVGGVEDHVHALVQIPSTVTVAELVKQLKGASSHFVNHALAVDGLCRWQGSYGAFTVSPGDLGRVELYVRGQEARHQANDLLSELETTGWQDP
ncbi:MAG: transposase [Armatimonadetes bacterium]|nr:transposase [Armatimonadota bacterium]